VRLALEKPPRTFESLDAAMAEVRRENVLGTRWEPRSGILDREKHQMKLDAFF
jgi:hypothetical protein